MTVLKVSCYAFYRAVGNNTTVVTQALGLDAHGVDVEILTWPRPRNYRASHTIAHAPRAELAGVPYHQILIADRIPTHVVKLPEILDDRVLTPEEWRWAVDWGKRALDVLRPDVLHQHAWRGMWWMLDAAIQLGIPTVYTAHDFGLACLRTVMMMGNGQPCDGTVGTAKCSACILSGRNVLGRANEWAAGLPGAERLLTLLYGWEANGPLARFEPVRIARHRRVDLHLSRCRDILSRIDAMVVSNPYAGEVFQQFGIPPDRIHVIPWAHAQPHPLTDQPTDSSALCLGFAGRIAPEKGLHVLLNALSGLESPRPVELRIAGEVEGEYAKELARRYERCAGPHRVTWCGWVPNHELDRFYADVHVAVFPSICFDMTPTAMVDAVAHHRPIVCTDIPTMTSLVTAEQNGLVFPMADVHALRVQLRRLAADPALVARLAVSSGNVFDAYEYGDRLTRLYERIPKLPLTPVADIAL